MKKDSFVIVLDVSPSASSDDTSDGKSFLKKSVKCLDRIIQRKIFAKSGDELAVIAFGTAKTQNPTADDTEGFEHISVERHFDEATWDMLKDVLSKKHEDVVDGDWLKALYAAIDYFVSQFEEREKSFKSLTIVFFTDFGSPFDQDEKRLNAVIDNLRHNAITLYFIGPELPEESQLGAITSDVKREGMTYALKIKNSLGEAFANITFEDAEVEFASLPKKQKRPMPWNVNLRISQALQIPVSGFIAVSKETIPSWREEVADKPGTGVVRERTYVKKDVEMTEVKEEDIITGYLYGSKIVPFAAEDEKEMSYKPGSKGMSLICFADASSIHENYYMGNNTMYFIARKDDKRAQVLLSALIHALSESGKVAIVRRVYNDGNRPKIGFLAPVIKLHIEYLTYIQLPYSEDVKTFAFPSLDGVAQRLTSEQCDAVDDLIDSMDLSNVKGEGEAYKSIEILNPYIQYVYRVLSYRQLHPEEPLREYMEEAKAEAMKPLEISEELKEASALSLKRIAETFPVEVIEKKKRKVEELGIGQREEEAISEAGPSGLKQPKTQDLNISDILGSKITAVGTVTPVEDFQTLISRGEDSRLACIQLEDVVIRLIVEAPTVSGHHLLQKAIDCLKVLRAYCVKADPDIFNVWTKKLKQAIAEKKDWSFLDRLKKENLGPINREENVNADVSPDKMEEFFAVEEEVVREREEAAVTEENLLEEL